MSWFKRVSEGITTKTKEKKATPDGLWDKCPRCKAITPHKDLIEARFVCPSLRLPLQN
jgi:acetyl-CoA carboxylase carboxyl transferase subunit beta